jgi:UDP-glucose 4-epimerase
VEAVIHFAGLKAVGESIANPLAYWDGNVAGSLQLLAAMRVHGCRTIVFSSSATVYGIPDQVPIPETAPLRPINPYGQTKAAVEQLLADVAASEPGWRIGRLRYFNPVGAHPSGRIGEDPHGTPNNLFPFVSQVAVGRRDRLQVYGGDWPTADGSGVRDYIHVMDLAEGHRAALACLLAEEPQVLTVNLGSGQGHSVLEVVGAFAEVSGQPIPYEVVQRREGDAACSLADPALATARLGWSTTRSLVDMCRDGWAWQQANPHGYGS